MPIPIQQSGYLPARRPYFPKEDCLFGLSIIEEIKRILTNIYKDNEFETNYAIKGDKKQRDKQIIFVYLADYKDNKCLYAY